MGPDQHSEASYFDPPEQGSSVNPAQQTSLPAQQQTDAIDHALATPVTENPPPLLLSQQTTSDNNHGSDAPARQVQFRPLDRNQSAIRLRRISRSSVPLRPGNSSNVRDTETGQGDAVTSGRHRSRSDPVHFAHIKNGAAMKPLPAVPEGGGGAAGDGVGADVEPVAVVNPRTGRIYRMLRRRQKTAGGQDQQAASEADLYDARIVDFLDVVDPEVATLSSITNVQNSLFVPSLGRWVNRRPTYDLSHIPQMPGAFPPSAEDIEAAARRIEEQEATSTSRPDIRHAPSLSSVLTAPQYAILPDDKTLEGWDQEDVKLLNDYVRHMLHSRRSKIKQRLKAFGKYARRPLGFLVTLYATLITLFGLAWVLFLIGWIYVGDPNRQLYAIEVIDQVLVALFAVVGDGLAPFRAIDTYHMFFVAHYHRKTWKMRKKLLLPSLKDRNDLPTDASASNHSSNIDLEAAAAQQTKHQKDDFFPVLSEKEQARLIHHQAKLAKSHTFYKPHETDTHRAFPLRLLVTVVLLLDLHSCLQISLGACTWGIPYEVRPAAVTTTILCLSITTNAVAGLLIALGDRRTRKKDVLERLLKQELTAEVMHKMEKDKKKEEEKEREVAEGGDKRKVLGISVPWPENLSGRRSEDGRKSEVKKVSGGRKSKDQAGSFDVSTPRMDGGNEENGKVPGAWNDEK